MFSLGVFLGLSLPSLFVYPPSNQYLLQGLQLFSSTHGQTTSGKRLCHIFLNWRYSYFLSIISIINPILSSKYIHPPILIHAILVLWLALHHPTYHTIKHIWSYSYLAKSPFKPDEHLLITNNRHLSISSTLSKFHVLHLQLSSLFAC